MTGDPPKDAPGSLSDRTLLRRMQSGEPDAATDLYLRYAARLNRLVNRQMGAALTRRLESDDIVQSVFRTFFRRAAQGHYEVAESEELWRLLLVIALNKVRRAAGYFSAAKRDQGRTVSMGEEGEAGLVAPRDEHSAAYQMLQWTLQDLFSQLPVGQEEIVRLRIEGYTLPEIAERTGRALRTIERVLKSFREMLVNLTEGEP